jgi:ring-1,2-phenylacetyl-CoA epoxidase subunit PaaD
MVSGELVTAEAVWAALEAVKDPEIPVISVVDLGLIRDVQVDGGRALVLMTPTFLGCPAIDVMQTEIDRRLRALGMANVEVRLILSPPWTSDWITDRGRAQLKAFGLAPPAARRPNGLIQIVLSDDATCPHCGSRRTEQKNPFGATLCRALYYCHNCQQPFEQFKAL